METSEQFLGRLHREKCQESDCIVCKFYNEVTVISEHHPPLKSLWEVESEMEEVWDI